MHPDNAAELEQQPAGMGQFSRIIGVLFEPKKTFEDIAQRPSFLVPLLLIIVVALAYTSVMAQRIGFERVVRQQVQNSEQFQQLPADQREQRIQMGVKFASVIGYAASVVGPPLYWLVASGVLLGITAIMSAGLKFKQIFAIMAYAAVPGILYMILTMVVMFLKNPDEFNIQNPLAFNPAAFLDPLQTSKFVYSLASSLDLFSFWAIGLIAIGLKAAAGKRLSFGGALFAVLLPWALFVFVKAAFAGIGGR
jgi:hypothetical protein